MSVVSNVIELDLDLTLNSKDLLVNINTNKDVYTMEILLSKVTLNPVSLLEEEYTEELSLLIERKTLSILLEENSENFETTLVLGKYIKGVGVPDGGNIGDVLVKQSNDSFDTKWVSGIYSGDKHYYHLQGQPNNIWTVVHLLNKYPSVTVFDSAGTIVFGNIRYIDLNTVELSFGEAFAGKAALN